MSNGMVNGTGKDFPCFQFPEEDKEEEE